MMTGPRYFPILDALRFLACMCVFMAHSVTFFNFSGIRLSFPLFMEDAGYFGVVFFYTLSGFLITYLLLKEKENSGTIAVMDFYVRRALRIWPLYYAIILLSFFVFPNLLRGHPVQGIGDWPVPFLLYLLMLPNLAMFGGYYLATCYHTYTIGFEEQFYLFWPLFVRKAGGRAGYVLAVLFALPWALDLLRVRLMPGGLPISLNGANLGRGVLIFISLSNIPAFIAGAAAAWLYLKSGRKFRAIAGNRIWRLALAGAVLFLMCCTVPEGPGYVNGVSVIFALLILNLAWSEGGGGWIGAVLVRGGRISYGIYIYHVAVFIAVSIGMKRAHVVFPGRPMLTYLLYVLASLILLLLVSAVSYRYFEQYFLRKKKRFRPIPEN